MFIKKMFPVRRLLAYLFISLLVGGTVYIKQSALSKQYADQAETEFNNLKRNHFREVSMLESQLNSLVSRIKHLSEDNTRLTATGQKLYKKLEVGTLTTEEKLAASRKLHVELSSLDRDIINKYEFFIGQQRSYEQLRFECRDGQSKSKSCERYSALDQEVKATEQQLKYLNARREVLVSQIDRSIGNL